MLKVGELLAFEASPNTGGAILGHGGPVVALSDDFLCKHVTIHVGSVFLTVDLLHYLFNVSPWDTVQMSSIEVPLEQSFMTDDVLGDQSSEGCSVLFVETHGIPTVFEEAPYIIVPAIG